MEKKLSKQEKEKDESTKCKVLSSHIRENKWILELEIEK